MELLDATYLMNNCDYSFGAITVENTLKAANIDNAEFIQKYVVTKSQKSYMTLFIDNIRLYRRKKGPKYNNMENPGIENWEVHRKSKDTLIDSFIEEDLLDLCTQLSDMNFIIFTGFEDTSIDDEIFDKIPSNVLAIYASSSSSFGGKVIPFPFGLARRLSSDNRLDILKGMLESNVLATKKLYLNHSLGSNVERVKINEFFSNKDWVTMRQPKAFTDYPHYLNEVKEHKFMICPDGNAIDCDCYRNWEVLYMKRVPVVKRSKYLEKIFEGFPVLFVDSFEDVTESLLRKNEHLYQNALTLDPNKLDIEVMYSDIVNKFIYIDIIDWIKKYTKEQKFTLVVGISGGIDSALVSTLCAMTDIETYVVSLPINQNKDQLKNAKNHIQWLKNNFKNVIDYEFDMTTIYDSFAKTFVHLECDACHHPLFNSQLSLANSKSRLRMIALYQIASNMNGLVVGTGNKVEDFGIGFFTKYGDGGVDISPIADLNKSEVRKLAKTLGIIDDIIKASPTDGLWEDNRTDESQIGATYEELEWAMEYTGNLEDLDGRKKEVCDIYNKLNTKNQHKMNPIPIFKNKK